MMTIEMMQQRYDALMQEGTRLAGDLTDLTQRAAVYRQLFLESHGNHVFPLIAAHGALWAGGYFRFGMKLGRLLNRGRRTSAMAIERLNQLTDFANAFREINRRVCVDTYVNFIFTRELGNHPEVTRFVAPELVLELNHVHAAAKSGVSMTDFEKQGVFKAHFLNEQEHVVGPTLQQAVKEFDWPLMKSIALRPMIRFAYFPTATCMWFHDFTSREERIRNGLRSFRIAAKVGWDNVEAALERYSLLPAVELGPSAPDLNPESLVLG